LNFAKSTSAQNTASNSGFNVSSGGLNRKIYSGSVRKFSNRVELTRDKFEDSKLLQRGKVIAEYIWIDGSMTMRSKSRTLEGPVTSLD